MRKHNGMRPQDVVILLKIIALNNSDWRLIDVAGELEISVSEVSESLNRSVAAGLIDYKKKAVKRMNLMEFIEHGLKYVFPQQPGTLVRGVPTAHAHPSVRNVFVSEMDYVWPDQKGTLSGLAIEPLYKKQTSAVLKDQTLYFLLALVDLIRVGRVREVTFAVSELKKQLLNESS